MNELIDLIGPVMTTIIAAIFGVIGFYIRKYVKGETPGGVLSRLNDVVYLVVNELNQTVVKGLREASEDGRLTTEEKSRIYKMASDRVLSYIGVKGMNLIAHVIGMGDMTTRSLADAMIESAVKNSKNVTSSTAAHRATELAYKALEKTKKADEAAVISLRKKVEESASLELDENGRIVLSSDR